MLAKKSTHINQRMWKNERNKNVEKIDMNKSGSLHTYPLSSPSPSVKLVQLLQTYKRHNESRIQIHLNWDKVYDKIFTFYKKNYYYDAVLSLRRVPPTI